MAPDDDAEDRPQGRPLPPEDRLWRHPSEMGAGGTGRQDQIVLVERTQLSLGRLLAIAAGAALLSAAVTVGIVAGTGILVRERPGTTSHEVRDRRDEAPGANLISVANRVLDSVVHLEATGPNGSVNATAVVFRSDGHLITTADAVDAADSLTVVLPDSRRISTPAVEVAAKSITADIAILKIPVEGLTPAAGSQLPARRWAPAVVVDASPITTGPSITDGVITRDVAEGPSTATGEPMYGLIEATTKAGPTPFSPGTLFLDEGGTVIGLVTDRAQPVPVPTGPNRTPGRAPTRGATAPASGGNDSNMQHYALAADHVWDIAAQLADTGQVVQPWVGLPTGEDLTAEEARREGIDGGLRVTSIEDDSPAAAELQRGDVIVSLDSNTNNITGYNAFVTSLRRHAVGSYVTVRVLRKGSYRDLNLPVGSKTEK